LIQSTLFVTPFDRRHNVSLNCSHNNQPTHEVKFQSKKCQKMSFFHLSLSHTWEIMGQFQAIYVSFCHPSPSFSPPHTKIRVWMSFFLTRMSVCVRERECVWEREREIEILGVNFTNVLRAAFMITDPKSAKRQSSHKRLFALLDSAHVKAACKTLVKLTPRYVPLTSDSKLLEVQILEYSILVLSSTRVPGYSKWKWLRLEILKLVLIFFFNFCFPNLKFTVIVKNSNFFTFIMEILVIKTCFCHSY